MKKYIDMFFDDKNIKYQDGLFNCIQTKKRTLLVYENKSFADFTEHGLKLTDVKIYGKKQTEFHTFILCEPLEIIAQSTPHYNLIDYSLSYVKNFPKMRDKKLVEQCKPFIRLKQIMDKSGKFVNNLTKHKVLYLSTKDGQKIVPTICY